MLSITCLTPAVFGLKIKYAAVLLLSQLYGAAGLPPAAVHQL